MSKQKERNSVLIVDDEKANIIALTHILSEDYIVYAAKNGKDALEVAKEYLPDVILLDIIMPEMDGYEVIKLLKENDDTKEIPVIFVTGLASPENEERGLSLGASDYIGKPFSPPIVRLRVKNQIQILKHIDTIRHLSTTDQLTGISNRRNFDYRLKFEWEHAKREKRPLSVFILDIDFFKNYNDSYGHMQGDHALIAVATTIERALTRSVDFCARWGGEEFAVLLPNTEEAGALSVAEHIRKNVENLKIEGNCKEAEKVTVSIGVNIKVPQFEDTVEDFMDKADKALYTAKEEGRNRVSVYRE